MEERIKDSYYYESQGAKDGLKVYTSKQDPNATAIDLIDAVYGKVYTIKQDTKSPEKWIVIYTTNEVSVISTVNDTTYVEVGLLKNLPDSENTPVSYTHLLGMVATSISFVLTVYPWLIASSSVRPTRESGGVKKVV